MQAGHLSTRRVDIPSDLEQLGRFRVHFSFEKFLAVPAQPGSLPLAARHQVGKIQQ